MHIGGTHLLINNRIPAALTVLICLVTAALCAANIGKPLFTADEQKPSDAVVLFDGRDLSQWVKTDGGEPAPWRVENGYMEVRGGNIRTRQAFGDCQLHVEFWLPLMADATGQARANSGVYLQGRYEVQVLDSYGLKSGGDDCGAIYGVAAPTVNACRPPRQWQSYDIIFRAPKFDDKGEMTDKARMTVLHNGVLIHENVELSAITTASTPGDPKAPGPVMLQDHGNAVRYRNIWIRPL